MARPSFFESLLPPCVRVAEMDPSEGRIWALAAEERAAVSDAVPHRQREFAAGRQLAAGLMDELGLPRVPLIAHADRSPVWPDGVVGSITHCPSRVAVAVVRAADAGGIGIDIEPSTPLPEGLEPLVLTAEEAGQFIGRPSMEQALRGRLVFSAKEATYKAVYPLTKQVLEFADLAVSWEAGRFVAVLRRAAPPFRTGTRFAGSWALHHGYIGTAVVLGQDRSCAAVPPGENPAAQPRDGSRPVQSHAHLSAIGH